MHEEKAGRVCAALKGIALMELVEAGAIERDADGNVDADRFERFWGKFSWNLYVAICNEFLPEPDHRRRADPQTLGSKAAEPPQPELEGEPVQPEPTRTGQETRRRSLDMWSCREQMRETAMFLLGIIATLVCVGR